MIIKNYYINFNKKNFIIDKIIEYLIKNNISFLYIEESNELHFDQYIIRFYDIKNFKHFIYDEFFSIFENICENVFLDISDDFPIINNNYKKNNFNNIKKLNNFKINNKSKSKILKKQLNPTRKIYK